MASKDVSIISNGTEVYIPSRKCTGEVVGYTPAVENQHEAFYHVRLSKQETKHYTVDQVKVKSE